MDFLFEIPLTSQESERIPGELTPSIKALYKDSIIVISISNSERIAATTTQSHIEELLTAVLSNFKRDVWKLAEITAAIDKIDEDISSLAQNNLVPPLIVKFRNELTNVDKISYRVDDIMETTFIPAAYMITQIAIGMVIFVLLFVQIDPYLFQIVVNSRIS